MFKVDYGKSQQSDFSRGLTIGKDTKDYKGVSLEIYMQQIQKTLPKNWVVLFEPKNSTIYYQNQITGNKQYNSPTNKPPTFPRNMSGGSKSFNDFNF